MNVRSKHFSMRRLIMGLGRVQEAKYVKICGPGREKLVLQAAQEALLVDMDCEDDDNDEPMEFDDPFADVSFDE